MTRRYIDPWTSSNGRNYGEDNRASANIGEVMKGYNLEDPLSVTFTEKDYEYHKFKSPVTGKWIKTRAQFDSKQDILKWLSNNSELNQNQIKNALLKTTDDVFFDEKNGLFIVGDEPADIGVSDRKVIIFADKMAPRGETKIVARIYKP